VDTPEKPPDARPPEAQSPWGEPAGAAVPGPVEIHDAAGPPSPIYPARLEIAYPTELSRWLPFVKWLLLIPHFIALWFVALGAIVVVVYGFFAVLITGSWPRGAFGYLTGTARWAYRVSAYFHLMTDAYPPFSLADHAGYPVRLTIEYPGRIARWRPLVQWLLAIPYLWIAGVLYWLTGALTVVAFFTILFTKRIPRGLFELMVPGLRWNLRGNAYAYFLTARYPPFVWG
jgi:Domain of unknown function (DUF4389)